MKLVFIIFIFSVVFIENNLFAQNIYFKKTNGFVEIYNLNNVSKLSFNVDSVKVSLKLGQNAGFQIQELRYFNFKGINNKTLEPLFMKSEIEIYPNPFENIVNVIVNKEIYNSQIQIFSIDGNLCYNDFIPLIFNEFQYDLSFLKSGFYILVVSNEFEKFNYKLIKK